MPVRNDVAATLKNILNERFGIDPCGVSENSRLQDLGVDSLHVLNIMLDVESMLGVKLDELSLPRNPSLGEIADMIRRNMAAS